MAESRMDKLILEGRQILNMQRESWSNADLAFRQWEENVARWLHNDYPETGLQAHWLSLAGSPFSPGILQKATPAMWTEWDKAVRDRMAWLSEFATASYRHAVQREDRPKPNPQLVFVVHGHNEAAREAVARFISKLGLTPIILHEQANEGKTIIEKFVHHSDVGFAVVLLTADDIGGPRGTPPEKLQPRARQNVILELGFFLDKLGRPNVCPLYEEGVELPSDFQGVLYTPLDSEGAWQLRLAKEMKAAGLAVDLNRL